MLEKYENCSSYSDNGYIDGGYEHRVSFKTQFKRPRFFRCEWKHENDGQFGAVWSDGSNAFIYGTKAGTKECGSLASAIATVAGVSAGTSTTIATMLLPELRDNCRSIATEGPFELVSGTAVESCIVLRNNLSEGNSDELWIKNSTFELLKVVSHSTTTKEQQQRWLEYMRSRCPELVSPKQVAEFEDYIANNPERTKTSIRNFTNILFDSDMKADVFQCTFGTNC